MRFRNLELQQAISHEFLKKWGYSDAQITDYFHAVTQLRLRYSPYGNYAPEPHEYFLTAPDGIPVFVREFIPPHPKAVLLCQHGNDTQSDLYFPLADHLYYHDIALITVDNRGHGRTGPNRGDLDKPSMMFPIYDFLLQKYAQYPCHMLGKSLGTAMIAAYWNSPSKMIRKLQSIIFLVPPYRVRSSLPLYYLMSLARWFLYLTRILSLGQAFMPFKPDFRPSYYYQYHKLDQIDIIRGPKNTARHIINEIILTQGLPQRVRYIKKPVLILEGTEDQLLDPQGTLIMARSMKHTYRKVHIYNGADHSLLLDKNSQGVYDLIIRWISGEYHSPLK